MKTFRKIMVVRDYASLNFKLILCIRFGEKKLKIEKNSFSIFQAVITWNKKYLIELKFYEKLVFIYLFN